MTSEQTVPAAANVDDFEDVAPAGKPRRFMVELGGFEGPLDLLLMLARQQKVDLKNISILELADQYLLYISAARKVRLELAADYLVMAAWLAYLKSRLLLPEEEGQDEPSGEELAARLQHQLRRLEAMRQCADQLLSRNRLGLDVFPRGMPEGIRLIREGIYECSLYELLNAYARQVGRNNVTTFKLRPTTIHTVDDALQRLGALLGSMPDWATLETFLPESIGYGVESRSAVSATFVAVLEMVKQGKASLRQARTFGPIFVKGSEQQS